MNLEDIIYQYTFKNGIEDVGICSTDDFLPLKTVLQENNARLKGFVEQDINKRINPGYILEDAKSIIVFALGYKKFFDFEADEELRGRISEGAIGEDYHITLKNKFLGLAERLKEFTEFEYKIFVDTGPLVDREVAKRAGIGYYGKSGAIISKKAGSKIFLGYMVTTLSLPCSDIKLNTDICKACSRCIQYCPSKALSSKYEFKYESCISYLTQVKGLISMEKMRLMGLQIYGCDICQNVCPRNKNVKELKVKNIDDCMPKLKDLILMTNREFDDKYKKTAMGWRGKKIIQRNAVIALGNTKRKSALEVLKYCLNDDRELIRHTAVRSIFNLGFDEGLNMLYEHLILEPNNEIREEIKYLLYECCKT